MSTPVKPIPDGYAGVIPYLIIDGAAKALDFYAKAFGAEEVLRMGGPDGKIGHAEIRVFGAMIMLADECPERGFKSPSAYGGTPVSLYMYVKDVDAVHARAVAAGAKVVRPLQNQFYGDRSAQLLDPFGHAWGFATHVEDVAPDELERRAKAAMG